MEKNKILIVEDETIVATELENRLTKLGYAVSAVVESGEKAITVVENERPDVILMGITSAGAMNGMETARRIKERFEVPIVFVTARADQDRIDQAKPAMPFGCLLKPVNNRELKERLEMALYVAEIDAARKKAELEVKSRNDCLQVVLESFTYPFYIVDSNDYSVVMANSAASRRGILPARTCYSLIHDRSEPCRGQNHACPIEAVKQDKKPVTMDHIHFDAEGNKKYVELHSFPICNQSGEVVQVIEYLLDAIDQNQEYRDQVINEATDRGFSFQNRENAFSTENGTEKASSRSRLSAELPLPGWHSRPIGLDVTQQVTTEEALRESEQLSKKLLTSTLTGLCTLDLVNRNFTYVNPQFTRITGYTMEELGKSAPEELSQLLHPDDFASFLNFLQDLSQTTNDSMSEIELRLRYKHAGWRWYLTRGAVFARKPDGTVLQIIVSLLDITDRKQLTERLQVARLEAETANRAKSEFIASMSHELRTPLNTILGFSQVLELQIKKKLSKKQLYYLNIIRESGNHLLEMVNDILDLSKIEAGKTELEFRLFDFGEMLNRIPDIIRSNAAKKNLNLEVAIQPNLGWLNGDESKLKQVIFNLFSNAVKFTTPGKNIGIEATVADETFTVVIWDEGIGIPETCLDKIFEPFEQVKKGNHLNEKGTGLGLAISKHLVEAHQGSLSVVSTVDKGSRFTISLPGRTGIVDLEGEAEAVASAEEVGSQLTGQRILVVEDNDSNRSLLKAALEQAGCLSDCALSGEEAVEKALVNDYHLILMDIQLPGINGVEAMQQIRSVTEKPIPIIALTAFAMKGDKQKYLQQGFDDYISKPIDVKRLFEKMRKATTGGRMAREKTFVAD